MWSRGSAQDDFISDVNRSFLDGVGLKTELGAVMGFEEFEGFGLTAYCPLFLVNHQASGHPWPEAYDELPPDDEFCPWPVIVQEQRVSAGVDEDIGAESGCVYFAASQRGQGS